MSDRRDSNDPTPEGDADLDASVAECARLLRAGRLVALELAATVLAQPCATRVKVAGTLGVPWPP